MGPNEPYWQTNSSFSPPLSSRWDQMFQSEGVSHSARGGLQLYDSSQSSNSKESRGWVRNDQFPCHHYSASDGIVSQFSSPSDAPQHTAPLQGVGVDSISTTLQEPASSSLLFPQSTEGHFGFRTSAAPNSCSSTSHSDASECEHMGKSPTRFLPRNFASHCSFMSKSVHPLSFPNQGSEIEAHVSSISSNTKDRGITSSTLHSDSKSSRAFDEPQPLLGSSDLSAGFQHDGLLQSSSSSIDFTDISDQFDLEYFGLSCNMSESLRCGICERLLSQRSPWSSVRIVRCGDMPVAGVLSCSHVYHAECLEHNTPKFQKHDPPCPLCAKSDEEIRAVPEQHVLGSRMKSGFPKLKSTVEDDATSSRSWSCGQWGDCVEGTIQAPVRGNLSSLNKHHLKKQCTKRGNSSKDLPESVVIKKRGLFSSKLFNGRRTMHPFAARGCSRSTPSVHSLKGW
ncbi:uncharacterized protein LOC116248000 [Nymphaea colorata]|nr:uncharacterized protein LOC116248000 [Nymphaea colorata]XP_031476392.1 uncharacterized protein LOC116248000 [Nymphaea colorata]